MKSSSQLAMPPPDELTIQEILRDHIVRAPSKQQMVADKNGTREENRTRESGSLSKQT
jgi:hypothetical protein